MVNIQGSLHMTGSIVSVVEGIPYIFCVILLLFQ